MPTCLYNIDYAKVDADLTNFPVQIYITGDQAQLIIDELGEDYQKLKVLKEDESQLYVEVDLWDTVNNRILLWVSRDDFVISSTEDTRLTIDYSATNIDSGHVGTPGTVSANNVWDSNYKAVYHMSQDPSGGAGCIIDSTSNGNNGTPNAMTSGDLIDGEFGKCLNFDGIDNDVRVDTLGSFGTSDFTWEAKIKASSSQSKSYAAVMAADAGGSAGTGSLFVSDAASGHMPSYVDATTRLVVGTFSLTDDAYHKVDVVRSNGTAHLYIDGELDDSAANSTVLDLSSFTIGATRYSPTNTQFKGSIEMIAVSDDDRSEAWIKASNYSLRDNLITQVFPVDCAGNVRDNMTSLSGALIRLYRRTTGDMVGETYSDASGDFNINSVYDEAHYAIAFYPDETRNALIYDYLSPTTSGA